MDSASVSEAGDAGSIPAGTIFSAAAAPSLMPPRSLLDLTLGELETRLEADGVRSVHARVLFAAIHRQGMTTLAETPHFPPPLQRWLERTAPDLTPPKVASETASTDGRTRKYLLQLADGQTIETVLMGYPGRFTACLSTQVGCAMGCVFCATGQMGFTRHLQPAEIVAQVLHGQRELQKLHGERLRNLVLMGMGEPLHNLASVLHALEILTEPSGANLGPSRISISTVGHVPGIRTLARHPKRYHLAVSLHAATDEERSALLPINQRWPLAELLDACREYSALTSRKIFIAWTLIAGRNDTPFHARQLATLLQGMNVQVNLIPLNVTADYDGTTTNDATVGQFQRILLAAHLPTTIRQRRGIDVAAGCGQLKTARKPSHPKGKTHSAPS